MSCKEVLKSITSLAAPASDFVNTFLYRFLAYQQLSHKMNHVSLTYLDRSS